jgi:prepilin-type N-terminal cleavage/methylation domain-containing protein
MRTRHAHTEGFTLVELLLVLVVIAVLAGTAIAQVAQARTRAFDAQVSAAVRGVATGEEAYFASNIRYTSNLLDLEVETGDVTVVITPGNSGDLASSFRVEGSHPKAGRRFVWLSDPPEGAPNLEEF